MPFRSVIRFGSTTEMIDAGVEINTAEAIKNSASKLRMKTCFTAGNVRTAKWYTAALVQGAIRFLEGSTDKVVALDKIELPLVAKSIFGSRGLGNTLIRTREELNTFVTGHTLSNYIFEKFYNFTREYRLHVTEHGCFYTCRKMLKEETPKDKRWFRNDSNSVWIVEDNAQFDRPTNWDVIVSECVKAMHACGLDFGACDVKVQASEDTKGRKNNDPDFIVIEINSAPSFGTITAERYERVLPTLLKEKFNKQRK